MVHVAHDHHYGGPGPEILRPVLGGADQLLLDGDNHFLLHLAAHLLGDNGCGVKINHLAEGGHDAVLHQALDHLGPGLFHPAGQFTHTDLIRNLHSEGRLFGNLQLKAAQLLLLLLAALIGEGHLPLLLVAAAAEFFLVLLQVPLAAGGGGALRQFLQLLVIFVQIHICGLAGIHHLGLGDPGGGLLGRLGLARLLGALGLLLAGGLMGRLAAALLPLLGPGHLRRLA